MDAPVKVIRSSALGVAGLVVAAMALAGPAAAHEIGATRVVATLKPDATYRVDIFVDSDALLSRLDGLAGLAASAPRSPEEQARRLRAHERTFLFHTMIAFDGVRTTPSFAYEPPSGDPVRDRITGIVLHPPGIVRLEGHVPAGAVTLTWAYGLVYGSYALTVQSPGNQARSTQWLLGGRTSEPVHISSMIVSRPRTAIAWEHFALGYTHILPKGLDHILFVFGLFLLSTRWRPLLLQVSAFTLAHSLTLGLSIYGFVSLPPQVVEPLIALSIVYVAIENIVTTELKPWRLVLVCGFGLLHGLGFAGVLQAVGLPPSEFLMGLVTFNLGVEAGQLTVILLASLLFAAWRDRASDSRRSIVVPASVVMAVTGLVWAMQRLTT
jgi:hypothetical protein